MARAGVVAGRPHEGKNRSALRDRVTSGREGGRGGATGVVADVLEERGVRVEVAGLREALEMRGRVREEERGIGHRSGGRRHAPFPRRVSRVEVRGGAEDAGRLLGAQRGAVVGALRIVENEHGGSERESECEREAERAVTCVQRHVHPHFHFHERRRAVFWRDGFGGSAPLGAAGACRGRGHEFRLRGEAQSLRDSLRCGARGARGRAT